MNKTPNEIKEFYKEHNKHIKLTYRKVYLIEQIKKYVYGRNVYDVGCGDGFITAILSGFCNIRGLDLNVENVSKRFPNIAFEEFDIANTQDVPIHGNCVLFLDVMEHIPDEKEKEVIQKLSWMADFAILNIPETSHSKQIIERKVDIIRIISRFQSTGMVLRYFEHWGVSRKETYNFMVFKKVFTPQEEVDAKEKS